MEHMFFEAQLCSEVAALNEKHAFDPPPCLRARSWRVVTFRRVVLLELPTETPL